MYLISSYDLIAIHIIRYMQENIEALNAREKEKEKERSQEW